MWSHIEAASGQPTLGRPCFDVRPGYRKIISGSHVVFYRPIDGGIEVEKRCAAPDLGRGQDEPT
jgi:plasmid stabilization system protein ParE